MRRGVLVLLAVLAAPLGAQTPYTPAVGTVAQLPTCDANRNGRAWQVTDALDPDTGEIVAGGGSERVGVVCDTSAAGIKWVVHTCDDCGGAGGASSFDQLAGGTNTTAAMVVGTGASLAPGGSGTIAATSAAQATALAANGANCSAGSYPLGVDASGAAESCTDATTEIDSAVSTHASNTDAHHARDHAIDGATHTASGLTTGQYLRATGATTFSFAAVLDADLPSTLTRDAEAAAAYQPVDADLTSIAAISTTAFGRDLLALADQAALLSAAGAAAASHTHGVGDITGEHAGTDLAADLEEEAHASEHQHGGADEVATATPGANAVPKAGAGGALADGWVDGSAEADELVLAGDVDGAANAADLDEAAVEVELEAVLDLPDLQGVLTAAKGGTGDDTSASTGVPRIATGNWTYDAGVSHLAASTSADLATVLSDETGSGGGFVRATGPTVSSPTISTLLNLPRVTSMPGSPATGDTVVVTDDAATGDCDSGGGSAWSWCTYNGSAWIALGDGGGGGGGAMPAEVIRWAASSLITANPSDAIPPLGLAAGTNYDIVPALLDDSVDECRSGTFLVPAEIDTSGSVTFRVVWSSPTATSGAVQWDARHNSRTEGEAWDSALTTEPAASDATQGTVGLITITTWTETVASLGWVALDEGYMLWCRDGNGTAGTDDMAGDAQMHSAAMLIPRAE